MARKEESGFVKADAQDIDVQVLKDGKLPPEDLSEKKKSTRCVAIAVAAVVLVVIVVLIAVLVPTLVLKGGDGAQGQATNETTTPVETFAPAPSGPLWGTNDEYKEQCVTDGEFQYYCRADCMVNCQEIGMNGALLQSDSSELAYCSSTHELDLYGDTTCCCAEYISPSDYDNVTVQCLNEDSPQTACDAWCHLHSEILLPGTSIDCDPGYLYCMPIGFVEEDCQLPIECETSSASCCCDMMS